MTWEKTPSPHERPRALLYTARDGSRATVHGYEKLVKPCHAICQDELANRAFPVRSIHDLSSPQEGEARPDQLLERAAERHPSVLFSVSHGMGPPRSEAWTPAEARERQGAMVFGPDLALLPSDIARTPFLPGGLWFYLACFGAGTPTRSAYHHWLQMLAQEGMPGMGDLNRVLQVLSRDGGFTSGLAQAALANPDGPLAIMAHIDLAWSYSYESLHLDANHDLSVVNRAHDFYELMAKLVKGERAGVAILEFQRMLMHVSSALNASYDRHKRASAAPEGTTFADRVELGSLWMLRQDLRGYVLLGDPAVRLPLAPMRERSPEERRSHFIAGLAAVKTDARDQEQDNAGNRKASELAEKTSS